MFDLDAGKLLIVGVIMLIFIPPKDLPRVLRQVGQFVGRMRRMAAEFQGQFMDAMREADTEDLRREAKSLAEAARFDVGFDALKDLDRQMVAKTTRTPAAKAAGVVDEEFDSVTPAAPVLATGNGVDATVAKVAVGAADHEVHGEDAGREKTGLGEKTGIGDTGSGEKPVAARTDA